MTACALCARPINPGDRRISWFAKDQGNNITESGVIHLDHLAPAVAVTYQQTTR